MDQVRVEPLTGHWLVQQTKVSLALHMLAQMVTSRAQINTRCVFIKQQPESVTQLQASAAATEHRYFFFYIIILIILRSTKSFLCFYLVTYCVSQELLLLLLAVILVVVVLQYYTKYLQNHYTIFSFILSYLFIWSHYL